MFISNSHNDIIYIASGALLLSTAPSVLQQKQKLMCKKSDRAQVPLQRVAMDNIEPLPVFEKGHKLYLSVEFLLRD